MSVRKKSLKTGLIRLLILSLSASTRTLVIISWKLNFHHSANGFFQIADTCQVPVNYHYLYIKYTISARSLDEKESRYFMKNILLYSQCHNVFSGDFLRYSFIVAVNCINFRMYTCIRCSHGLIRSQSNVGIMNFNCRKSFCRYQTRFPDTRWFKFKIKILLWSWFTYKRRTCVKFDLDCWFLILKINLIFL